MKLCENESAVLTAMGSGQWNEDLRRHIETCESCRSTVILLPKIGSLVATTEKMPTLPDYRWIMIQSEIYKQESKRRFVRMISGLASGVAIMTLVIILNRLLGTGVQSPIDIFSRLKDLNWSVVTLLVILWFVSEFQLRFFFKLKTEGDTV